MAGTSFCGMVVLASVSVRRPKACFIALPVVKPGAGLNVTRTSLTVSALARLMPFAKMLIIPLVLLQLGAPRTLTRIGWSTAELTHVGSVLNVALDLPVGGIVKLKSCFKSLVREQSLLLIRLCFHKVLTGLGSSASLKRTNLHDLEISFLLLALRGISVFVAEQTAVCPAGVE